MEFQPLLGNQQLHSRLQAALRQERLPHCFLLAGPEGSGKKPLAQREVAAHCNISRSYVSRIEKKALQKLRTVLVVDDI